VQPPVPAPVPAPGPWQGWAGGPQEPPRILVLTADDDPTADFVLHELNARRVPFLRCDPGDFPVSIALAAQLEPGAAAWGGRLRVTHPDHRDRAGRGRGRGRELDLWSLRAVYYRRPSDFRFPGELTGAERSFAVAQARHGLFGVLAGLPGLWWVNHPAAMADARVKPYQLTVAAAAGLETPATLITNDPARVRAFAEAVGGRIVTKSLATMVTVDDRANGRSGVLYTADVPEQLWDDPAIAATAHLFQEYLPGVDVRVAVVDGQLFAAEIHPDDPAGPVDIRAHHDQVTYRVIDPPTEVATATRDLVDRLGLVFAALDFRIVPGRGWVLLEVNPNGQWAFVPDLRDSIACAIADTLHKACR
jgi:hypothetical protein